MANTANTAESSVILSADCAHFVTESVAFYFDAENSEKGTADSLKMALDPSGLGPDKVTLEHFTAVANAWKAGYKTKRGGASMEAQDMAWSRALKLTGYTKPKASTAGAVKKAESRGESAKVIEAEINKAGGDAVKISEAVANAAKSGDAKKAAVLTKALIKVQNDAGKAAKKAADDAARTKRKAIEAALKTASVEMLEKIAGIISGELVAVKKAAPAKKAAATK